VIFAVSLRSYYKRPIGGFFFFFLFSLREEGKISSEEMTKALNEIDIIRF
jgi:hypothetical protein